MNATECFHILPTALRILNKLNDYSLYRKKVLTLDQICWNYLTRRTRHTRYLIFSQYRVVATYELTCSSCPCGQQLPSVHINFNDAS